MQINLPNKHPVCPQMKQAMKQNGVFFWLLMTRVSCHISGIYASAVYLR